MPKSWTRRLLLGHDAENPSGTLPAIGDVLFLFTGSGLRIAFELIDEHYESKTAKEKSDKALVMRTKLSQEGFGGLSGQLLRFTNMISKLSQQGKTVILIALLEQNPKFNRDLVGAPALKGKDFPKALPGFMDFIGLVEPRKNDADQTIYPPTIDFRGDAGYLSKWTGYGQPGRGPLNITKILDRAHGRAVVAKGGA